MKKKGQTEQDGGGRGFSESVPVLGASPESLSHSNRNRQVKRPIAVVDDSGTSKLKDKGEGP